MGSYELSTHSVAPRNHPTPEKRTKVVKKRKLLDTRKTSQPGRKYMNGLMKAIFPVHSDLMEMYV